MVSGRRPLPGLFASPSCLGSEALDRTELAAAGFTAVAVGMPPGATLSRVIHTVLMGAVWQGQRMKVEDGLKTCRGSPEEGLVSQILSCNLFLFKKQQ